MITNFDYYYPAPKNLPAGWIPIIEKLTKDLHELETVININQVKEKFGGLRYYVSYPEDEKYDKEEVDIAEELIRKAEEETLHTCQVCGSGDASAVGGGWITTLCKRCATVRR